MPWKVPITVDGLTYPVEFGGDSEPSESDINAAVQQILAQSEQPPKEVPGYLSQLGTALSIGGRQMTAGVKGTFNALTGDDADTAEAMARMGALQREQEQAQTPQDIALTREFAKSKAAYDKAQGVWDTAEALSGYFGDVAEYPGAAFKQAVQSAPNAVIGTGTSIAGYALGGLLGAGAGAETGPGAILTGIAGAAAGGAVSNSLMEAGPAIYDVLNERTNGAAANMTAEQIAEVLRKDPTITSEGLKTGAIRGTVIGLVESLGMKGAGSILTIPERAAARAAQKTLMDAGVDVASKEAVEAAMKNVALRKSVSDAASTAKSQFTSAGNLARGAAATTIETASAGAGEVAAQVAAGQEIDPTAAVQEMIGEVGINAALTPAVKAAELAKRKPVTPAPDTDFARRAAMEGATEFRDTTAGVPVVVEGVTIATIPPGSDLSPDDVAAFAAEPDMLKTLARSGQITLPEIVKPVEGVDETLTDEMNQNIAAGAATAPATVKALEEAQALYEAQTLARERQAAEETLRQQEAERAAAEERGNLEEIASVNEAELAEAKAVLSPLVPGLEVVMGDDFGIAPINVSYDGTQLRVAPGFLRKLKKRFPDSWKEVLDLIVDEELSHKRDIDSRGGESRAQTQWAAEWQSAPSVLKRLVAAAYRKFNSLTDSEKGAELVRMRDQVSRLGRITESASSEPDRRSAAEHIARLLSSTQEQASPVTAETSTEPGEFAEKRPSPGEEKPVIFDPQSVGTADDKPTQTASGKKVGDKIEPGEDLSVAAEDDQSTPGMPGELTVLEVEGILDAKKNKVFARRRDMTPDEISLAQEKIRKRNAVAAEMGLPQEKIPQPAEETLRQQTPAPTITDEQRENINRLRRKIINEALRGQPPPAQTPAPTEQSVKLELTPDESGATGAGMKEEIQPVSNLLAGTPLNDPSAPRVFRENSEALNRSQSIPVSREEAVDLIYSKVTQADGRQEDERFGPDPFDPGSGPSAGFITDNVGEMSQSLRRRAVEGDRILPEEAQQLWNEREVIRYAWGQEFNSNNRRTRSNWREGWTALHEPYDAPKGSGPGNLDAFYDVLSADEFLESEGLPKPPPPQPVKPKPAPQPITPTGEPQSIPLDQLTVIPEDMARAEASRDANDERWQRASQSKEPIRAIRRPDGTLRIMDGHHRYLAARDRGDASIPVTIEPPFTPAQGKPTDSLPADQPTSGDVGTGAAVQRDPSKPEQMTPEERFNRSPAGVVRPKSLPLGTSKKSTRSRLLAQFDRGAAWADKNDSEKAELSSFQKRNDLFKTRQRNGHFGTDKAAEDYAFWRGAAAFFEAKQANSERRAERSLSGTQKVAQHSDDILIALDSNDPVSAEAVDTYGIKLPEGYVRQGELYVFQPTSGDVGKPMASDYTFSKSFSNDPAYLAGQRSKWRELFGKPAETVTLTDVDRVAAKKKWSKQTKDIYIQERKPLVESALREGKPVPAEVLADYPDLKPPAPRSPAPTPSTAETRGAEDEPFGKLPTEEVETELSRRTKQAEEEEAREKIEAPKRRAEAIQTFVSEGAVVQTRKRVVGRAKAREGGGDVTRTEHFLVHPDRREIPLSASEAKKVSTAAPRSPAENLVSFTAANGQKLVGEVQSVTGNKATVAYQWNGKTKTQVVPVSQLGSPVASVATPPKYLYNQEQNTRKLGKHFPTALGVHANHDFRKSFASMAKDTALGQDYQMIAKLLSNMPEFKNMDLHLVADENIDYAGEYSWNRGKPSIAINLRLIARGQVDALGSILHEALHHVTLAKVRNPQGAFENEVVSKLDLIRESVREYAESRGYAEALEYELGSTEEFITALFTRPDFQALIASIPDSAAPAVAVGKFRSLLSEIFRLIAELVHGKPVLRGSALEQAMTTSLALFNTPFRAIETGGLEALNAARSYAGERAQMPQFMRDSLETAQAMAAAGKTSEEIRAVTGWFPGKYDGKMRWEIPDEGANGNFEPGHFERRRQHSLCGAPRTTTRNTRHRRVC
jgi:hypothetical protein